MSPIRLCRLTLPLIAFLYLRGNAQSGADQQKQDNYNQLKVMIQSRKFRFNAQSATSMKGRSIQLNSEYSLQLNNDSLNVDLPYYGRAYSAPYNSSEGAMQFSTNEFSYTADTTKKGGWEISIKPKDQSKANTINLTVSSSGYCTVHVTSSSRQAISYYGTIIPIKQKN
jgi:hypothetical protein